MKNLQGNIVFFSAGAYLALDPESKKSSGGAELQVALLAKELTKLGCHVTIASAGIPPEPQWRQGVKLVGCGSFDSPRLPDIAAALPSVVQMLINEKPAWVVVYGWTAWLGVLVALGFLFGFRTAYVCALDGELDSTYPCASALRKKFFLWGVKHTNARFGITNSHVERFKKIGKDAKLTRLLLVPEFAGLDQKKIPPQKSVDLLWVARCHPVKKPERFLELVSALPETRCRMVCSPQDMQLFERVVSAAKQIKNLEFLDGVPYREIQAHFDVAKVFVNTSTDEGVPNTFLHAAAGGTAIASLGVDPDGCLREFGAGFSANWNFYTLLEGVKNLLNNQSALLKAAEGSKKLLTEWHDNSRNVKAFLDGLH